MMAILTVRNVPDEVHRALRAQAAQNGRSTEAEVRQILASAVKPVDRLRMGDALAAIGRQAGLSNEDVAAMEQARDKIAAEPMRFEP
jgi:plasmid stabilization protein